MLSFLHLPLVFCSFWPSNTCFLKASSVPLLPSAGDEQVGMLLLSYFHFPWLVYFQPSTQTLTTVARSNWCTFSCLPTPDAAPIQVSSFLFHPLFDTCSKGTIHRQGRPGHAGQVAGLLPALLNTIASYYRISHFLAHIYI